MGRKGQGAAPRAGYFPRVMLATLVVTVLPGLAAGALQAIGAIHSWLLSAGIAVVLSMALAAAGSAWWTRRPASRDIVFADLMLWGWLRRLRTERRLASARGLLGRSADLDPARHVALLERLSSALEARDPYTHGHSRRVTRHAYRIARELGLSSEQATRVRTAAAVHDVGKIQTPREVLNKPGRLTDDEFALIKRHAVDGGALVAGLDDEELTAIVRHHHERLDGTGYPDGLSGEQIPVGSRVIAVADTFDALTSNRPYRTGCRHKTALDVLRAEAGKQLDPDAVAAFLSYYSGRRALPVWSTVAAAPSRLAAWALSGIQGAAVAPLGGGVAALGAAFAVGAAISPGQAEIARPAEAAAAAEPAVGAGRADGRGAESSAGARSGARRGLGPGARRDGGRERGPGSRGRRVGGNGGPGAGPDGPGDAPGPGSGGGDGEGKDGAGGGGGSGGGGGGSGGGGGGSGGGGGGSGGGGGGPGGDGGGSGGGGGGGDGRRGLGDALPDLPDVRDLPDVSDLPDVPEVDLPEVDLPEVDLPVLPPIQPKLPPLDPQLPQIDLELPLG